jgi:hypothetical protein
MMRFDESISRLLREYVNSDMSALARYIGASEEERIKYLPFDFDYLFIIFLREEDIDRSELNLPNQFDEDTPLDEIIEWLHDNESPFFERFGKWLYYQITNNAGEYITHADLPSWVYFDDPKLVKNQWIVHFTNDADSIYSEGFKHGTDEMEKLGLTTWLSDADKKYGGYNFGYLISDKYKMDHGKYVYGDEAVLFRASGYRFYHNGDEEYQTIFRGATATCIIPLIAGEDHRWSARDRKSGNSLFESDDIDAVIKWVINNYEQYRKVLHR